MDHFDRRRRILVNGDEVRTDAALREAAVEVGLRIDAKVRLADALSIDSSGLSAEAYGYALRAHFDWVVSDAETTKSEFAVEFDGPSHSGDAARSLDRLKNEVCERLGLPLLRINGLVLRPHNRRTVLAVLVDAWAMYRAFTAEQEAGRIPWDEIFDPHMSLDAHFGENGELVVDQPYHLSLRAIALLDRLWKKGVLRGWRYATHLEEDEHAAFAWAYLAAEERLVMGQARIRTSHFPAYVPSDLAEDLALLDLADRLQRNLEGEAAMAVRFDEAPRQVPQRFVQFETRLSGADFGDWAFGSAG